MRTGAHWRIAAAAALVAALANIGACTKDNIIYRDKPSTDYPPPPEAAKGYIGYTDSVAKKPVCADCHLAQAAKWVDTKHAGAVATLAAIKQDGNQECLQCHTVNSLGNPTTDSLVGFASTHDPRYNDVQCESCHGVNNGHTIAPTPSNRPLATLMGNPDPLAKDGCVECHTDSHHPTAEEWRASAHGATPVLIEEDYFANNQTPCINCHSGQGALEKWGVNTNYQEKDGQRVGIACAVCHDPHGGTPGITAQLRFAVTSTDTSKNLCMKCHNRRFLPDQSSSRGVHAAETPTLFGYAGWKTADMNLPDRILGTHGDANANPTLCVTCHMNRNSVSDGSGNLIESATGHTFNPAPCLKADGTEDKGNTDCEISARSFKACTASGCHGSEAAAASAMTTAETRIEYLVTTLNAMIAQIPSTEFKTGDNLITTGEGAKFNVSVATAGGAPIHNPFLTETLLLKSISKVAADYSITVPYGTNLVPQLAPKNAPKLH